MAVFIQDTGARWEHQSEGSVSSLQEMPWREEWVEVEKRGQGNKGSGLTCTHNMSAFVSSNETHKKMANYREQT